MGLVQAPPSSTKKKANAPNAKSKKGTKNKNKAAKNKSYDKPKKDVKPKMDGTTTTTAEAKVGSSHKPDISLQTQLNYSRKGHAVLRSFLSPSLVAEVRDEIVEYTNNRLLEAWRQKVQVITDDPEAAAACKTVEECQQRINAKTSSTVPFLQYFNTWRELDVVKEKICTSPYLAKAASILLDVPSVRLYQDSVFWKRPGDGPTPYHSDARMTPFDTSRMVSFWIPLQPIDEDDTGLIFVDGSHNDFALPFWNDMNDEHGEYERLDERYGVDSISHHMPMDEGDVTVHSGWTLHFADEALGGDRYALSVTFVDARAEIRENALAPPSDDGKADNEDQWSYQAWVKDVKPRSYFEHPLVPIVWPANNKGSNQASP